MTKRTQKGLLVLQVMVVVWGPTPRDTNPEAVLRPYMIRPPVPLQGSDKRIEYPVPVPRS
jgi:hypothetical protein